MKRKLTLLLPFAAMPLFLLPYSLLDSAVLVKVFGCGCVPFAQTNMLNIAFNANDLRRVVFAVLAAVLFWLGIRIAKQFESKKIRTIYCAAVFCWNVLFALWVMKAFMWL